MSETTRRNFMKQTAAATAAAATINSFVTRSAHATGDETVKVALIGCGGRGSGAASQALSTQGPVKLVAVADAFADNAKRALENLKREHADRIDVKPDHIFDGFDAYQKAIDSDVDLVLIATPPGFRPIHFEYAVKQGKNVFAEKPVATDATGVRKFLAAVAEAKTKNLKVGIGLQRHHQAKYLEIVKRVHDGEIGDLRAMRVYWNDGGVWVRPRQHWIDEKKKIGKELSEMEYQMRNWYYFVWLNGDHITEQHIHNLDVANWVLKGPPVKAQGMGGRQVRNGIDHGEIYDHHSIEYTYADGTVVLSNCRHQPGCWKSVSEHAHGSKGFADLSGGRLLDASGKEIARVKEAKANPYQVEHDDLMDAIRNNKPYNEGEYGATSTMTSILGRMCSYSGQEIKWDDAINAKESVMPKTFAWDAPTPSVPNAEGRYSIPVPGTFNDDTVWGRVNKEIMSWGKKK